MVWDEAARQLWLQEGVLKDGLTEEEWLADGRWIIGDRVPEGHPGHVKKGWYYKSFVARPERYAEGVYPWKERTADNEWEFVKVFGGEFDLDIWAESNWSCPVHLCPGSWVDLPPEPKRRWVLHTGNEQVWGCGLLRKLPAGHRATRPGAGNGYEFSHLQMPATNPTPLTASIPSPQVNWRIQFIEIFDGNLCCRPGESGLHDSAGTRGLRQWNVGPKEHIFIARDTPCSFQVTRLPLHGVVIYY